MDIIFFEEEIPNINEDNIPGNLFINNRWLIPLIIAIFAIIIFNYQYVSPFSPKDPFEFNFDEFGEYVEKLKYEFDPFKLLNCNSGPQFVVIDLDLNEFCARLAIAKYSYTKMYSDGVLFFGEFEKCINNILNYISNKPLVSYIHREIDNNEEMSLSSSIEGSIETLETFYSSVKEAYEITLTAESLRNGTYNLVMDAKEEVQKYTFSGNNLNLWNKVWNYVHSIFDLTINIIDIITNTEDFLKHLDNDLEGIAKVLLNFKENLEKHLSVFHKLLANTESLKQLKWNEHEIKKIEELLNMIKENHKNFKSRVHQ